MNENIDKFPGSDELGMMELVIEGVAASKQLSDHLERVTKSSNEFGEATSRYNEDTPPEIISNPEALKARFDAYSQTMREYKNLIQPEISIFRAITENILSSIGQLMDLVIKEKAMTPEDIEGLITHFALLLKSIKTARDLLQDFRQILDRAPSITMEFRSAKKHLIRVLEEFIASYTIFIGAGETLTSETRRLM